MKGTEPQGLAKPRKITLYLLCGLTAAGLVMRLLSCFWGFPYPLHGDEHAIVDSAIDMLSRHSYQAEIYSRPDHFEIKCCAVLFQIVSYARYHVPAYEAFADHVGVFHLVARGFTAIWGTLMIPLIWLILEKCRKNAGLAGAAWVAFYPTFVQHSAYSTPDIVLAFFVMCITWFSILYMEKPSVKRLAVICALTGAGITVKYTCAISCIWIAIIVCRDCIRNKRYLDILKYGVFSAAVVTVTCFAIAPNLFTNVSETIAALTQEAGDAHLGADGLSMWGNFVYYIQVFMETAGVECVLFLILGIAYIIRKHNTALISMCYGLIFWICTSYLALHWERWGMPVYIFFLMVMVLGFFYAFDLVRAMGNAALRKIGIAVSFAFIILLSVNCVLSGIWIVRFSLMKDSRVAGKEFCDANGIVEENTIYDGYSPLAMRESMTVPVDIDGDGNLIMPADKPDAQYIIISSGLYGRFYAEPERYAWIIMRYDAIPANCELIYESELYETHASKWSVCNIIGKADDLLHSAGQFTGPEIKIYRYSG